MRKEERLVRDVCEMWSTLEGTVASYRELHHPDFVWWNCARGALGGVETCIQGVTMMHQMLQVASVEIEIKHLMAEEGRVMLERSDNLYRADGSVIAKVPVVGVVEFKDDKIISWRDYCDDWMRDFRPDEAPRALV